MVSHELYGTYGPTASNIIVGVLSAIVDNIPVMYAVLKMDPAMGLDQWLLITLTTGTGGSLLSVGSAAGVAVMGVDREHYTFMSHLKWAPVIAVGYAASILSWWLVAEGLG
jgi:Na+/H+ antiporter NhaD/arsenite permease-like protein